jgi:hypothetical protein
VSSDDDVVKAEARQIISDWIEGVARAEAQGFSPLAALDDLPGAMRADSQMWCERFFARKGGPYRPGSEEAGATRRAVHLATDGTFDLLRHEYDVVTRPAKGKTPEERIGLVVCESRMFVHVRFARGACVLARPAAERQAEVLRLYGAVLRLVGEEHLWTFTFPDAIEDGATFSTAPAAHPMMLASWTERADGGLRGGELSFVGAKKVAQLLGFPSPYHWFDEDFRAARRR